MYEYADDTISIISKEIPMVKIPMVKIPLEKTYNQEECKHVIYRC